MKTLKKILLISFLAVFSLMAKAQIAKSTYPSAVFSTKYTKDFVWDVQRTPAMPMMGKLWTLTSLKPAFDFTGAAIDWANGRYLMLVLQPDNANGANSIADDINRGGVKQNVLLNLYESNGSLVKTVSKWGEMIGLGDAGFVYLTEGKFATFFSNTSLTAASLVKYKVLWIKASKLSQFNVVKAAEATPDKIDVPVDVAVFANKYTKENVWDTQRSPAYPTAGQDWTLTGLSTALAANGRPIDWANGRYLMFSLENDNANTANSLIDDIRNGAKQNLVLKLYESNGKLVQVVSNWGYVIGIAEQGFMYEVEGMYGTFFANTTLSSASTVKYKPTLAKVTKVSELGKAKIMANANTNTNTNTQTWTPQIAIGYYTVMARCSDKYLDVLDASQKDGAIIQQWDLNGNQAQHWKIEPVLNLPGHYTLTARCSGKMLDVEGGSTTAGARIQQWTANGSAAQQWKIDPVPGAAGFYILTAKCSGKVLDVLDASPESGAKIQQWNLNGNKAQHWKLSPVK